MNTIDFSKEELKKLEQVKLSYEVYNTESDVLNFDYDGEEKIIKIFSNIDYDVFENKLYTVEMLAKYKDILPKSFCIPEALISVNGNIKGIMLPYIKGKSLISVLMNSRIKWENKRKYFIAIGKILDELKEVRENTELKDVYIGDLHDSNFITVGKENVSVIDLDSCKIAGNKSSISRFLTRYSLFNRTTKCKYDLVKDINERIAVNVDENTDLYCYYMNLLSHLYGDSVDCFFEDDYYRYLDYLDKIGFSKKLLEAFDNLISDRNNINPYEEIGTITEEQARRADAVLYGKYLKKKR